MKTPHILAIWLITSVSAFSQSAVRTAEEIEKALHPEKQAPAAPSDGAGSSKSRTRGKTRGAVSQPAPMTLTTTTRTAVISPLSHEFVTRGGSRGKVNIKATLSPAAAPNAASYSGQPAVAEVEVYDQTRTAFSNILFKLNSTIFADDASKQQLDNIAAVLRNHSTDTYLIEGHTCDLGEETKNQSLSLERAQAVANYLMRTGVRPEQLVVLGFGETDLLAQPSPTESPEQAESTRAQNRRVGVARVAAR